MSIVLLHKKTILLDIYLQMALLVSSECNINKCNFIVFLHFQNCFGLVVGKVQTHLKVSFPSLNFSRFDISKLFLDVFFQPKLQCDAVNFAFSD